MAKQHSLKSVKPPVTAKPKPPDKPKVVDTSKLTIQQRIALISGKSKGEAEVTTTPGPTHHSNTALDTHSKLAGVPPLPLKPRPQPKTTLPPTLLKPSAAMSALGTQRKHAGYDLVPIRKETEVSSSEQVVMVTKF